MKNQTMRRILSLLLAMVLCISLPMAAYAEAAEDAQSNDESKSIEEMLETVFGEDVADTVDEAGSGNSTGVNTETEVQVSDEGEKEVVDLTITFTKEENTKGETTDVDLTAAEQNTLTEGGLIVDYTGSADLTTDAAGNVIGEAEATYTVEDPTNPNYHAEGGIKVSQEAQAPEVTVDVPLVEDDPTTENVNEGQVTVKGDAVGTETEDGGEIVKQGEVTVETTEINTEIKVDTEYDYESDLDYVHSETTPTGSNDLIHEKNSTADPEYMPGYEPETPAENSEDQTGAEGDASVEETDKFISGDEYDYEYRGTGNSSQFRPSITYDEPQNYEEAFGTNTYLHESWVRESGVYPIRFPQALEIEGLIVYEDGSMKTDEAGYLVDEEGNRILRPEMWVDGPDGTDWLHRIDCMVNLKDGSTSGYDVEGWYKQGEEIVDENGNVIGYTDGEWLKPLNGEDKYAVVYATAQQFVLVDKETGEVITTYCADMSTGTAFGNGYIMENLEDADYYTDEQAKQIRAIAYNGYWGTTGTETVTVKNEDGTESTQEVPKEGSLEAMKQMLLESGEFTEAELTSLTDGVALTATQMAIWSCSNKMEGVNFVNSSYVGEPGDVTGPSGNGGDIPEEKEDETLLMFKIFEYLRSMPPVEAEEDTSETVITADNALKDMSIKVIEKDEEHDNNKDDIDTNDAYVTEVTFALIVTPSTENGDDMIVKVISNGVVLKEARIAGEAKEGETMGTLTADKDGNYTISNITLIEGEQEINISLEGVQNLEKGVYLFTSEVQQNDYEVYTKKYGEDFETDSQTMVGLANGKHAVNVSVGYKFELNVEDEVVYHEEVYYYDPVEPTPEIPEPTPTPDDPEPTPTPNDPTPTPTPDDPEPTPTPNTPVEDPEDPEDEPDEPVEEPDVPVEEEPEPTTPVRTPTRNDNNVVPKRPEAVLMIMDEAVPQAAFVEIFDEEVPLSDAPETGDPSTLWALMSLASASGLFLVNRRRKV